MRFGWVKTLVALSVVTLALSQVLLFIGDRPGISLGRLERLTGDLYQLEYTVSSSSYRTELNTVFFPVNASYQENLPVYILFDDRSTSYEVYGTWRPYFMIVSGLYNELRYQARLRGFGESVSLVDSGELQTILLQNQAAVVIVPTVTWNIELNPPRIDRGLLDSWVRNGGTLIWLGAPPTEFEELSLVRDVLPIAEWDRLENWWGRSVSGQGSVSVILRETLDGNHLDIAPVDLSEVQEGFYGAFRSPSSLDFSDHASLSFQLMVDGLDYLSSMSVRLRDTASGHRDYVLPLNRLEDGMWVNISVSLDSPKAESADPLNLTAVNRIYFVAAPTENASPQAAPTLSVRGLAMTGGTSLVSSRWDLTDANSDTEASRALNLLYGYVNLGVSVARLSSVGGLALGRAFDVPGMETRTSISLVPWDQGRVVIFGYGIVPPYYQNFVAEDLMRIIGSGILYIDGPLDYREYTLERNSGLTDRVLLDATIGSQWILYAFSKERHSGFAGQSNLVTLSG